MKHGIVKWKIDTVIIKRYCGFVSRVSRADEGRGMICIPVIPEKKKLAFVPVLCSDRDVKH